VAAVDDVFAYLEAQGIAGGSTGWDCKRRRMMDGQGSSDQIVVLQEDGGPAPEIKVADGIGDSAMKDAGVLVTVRATQWKSDDSRSKAQAVFDALHGKIAAMIGSRTYLRVAALTPEPVWIGFDEQGRPRHTIAFRLLAEM
jgi:hypothetical protein